MKRLKRFAYLIGAGSIVALAFSLALAQVPASFLRSGMIFGDTKAQSTGVGPAAAAYNAGSQSFSAGVGADLTFDTNAYDTGGIHSTSVNPTRFTALSTGFYQANCSVVMNTSGGTLQLFISVNGGGSLVLQNGGSAVGTFGNAGSQSLGTVGAVLKLNSGDYMTCYAQSANVGGSTQANYSFGQLVKLSTTF